MLASASPDGLEAHLTLLEREASNIGEMDKDGHCYWPASSQRVSAERIARRKGQNPRERAALKKRLLHKWMGK